jgi:hypothetical protein
VARSNDPSVLFGAPKRGKEGSARPPRGRTCDEPGCATVLSTYNASDVCWLHTPPAFRNEPKRP